MPQTCTCNSPVSPFAISLATALLLVPLTAQDLGGGAPGNHSRVARFELEEWTPGIPTQWSFVDLPGTSVLQWGALAFSTGTFNHPLLSGTVLVSTTTPTLSVFGMGTTASITIPSWLDGSSFFIQGFYFDAGLGGFVATDATQVNIFDPLSAVGTGTSRTIQVFDENTQAVTGTLSNSRNGRIHFTPDRTRAYVSQTDSKIRRYDVTASGMTFSGSFNITHRPRPGKGAVTKNGTLLYLPVQEASSPYANFIAIIDIDPLSATYNSEIDLISIPVVGPGAGPGNGAQACAVSPDGDTLYIAYAQVLPSSGPNAGKASIGVVDLTSTSYTFSEIFVTVGGNIANIHTMEHVEVSEDGELVYAMEQGFDPALPLINGYALSTGGALLTVASTASRTEVLAIPTDGLGQFEFTRDLLDRQLWIGQIRHDYTAEAICIDIDKHSPTRFTVIRQVDLDPVGYSVGLSGPIGIAITPDGSRVIVALDGDQNHADMIATVDARAGTLLGTTTISASDPETVSIQRY